VGVQGGVSAPKDASAIGWAESLLGFPGGGIRRIIDAKGTSQVTIEISTLNCAYRKWVIDKIGGFDESLKFGGEDYLLAKQASAYGQCIFVPQAIVNHAVRGNLIKIWFWFVRRGRAEVGVIRTGKYKNADFKSLMKASFLVKVFALMILGFTILNAFFLLIFVALFIYFGLQYLRFFKTWKTANLTISSLIVLPIVKLIMDISADFGRIKGLIFD
jgi:GT2 family glycosyltransferase